MVASTAISLLTATLAYYLVVQYTCNGLSRYPGPWLAKFTKFWHRISIKSNQHQRQLLQLHQKHGDVVRIGPNNLSIANPECISLIYGVKNEFLKSDMYDQFAPRVNGKPVHSWLSTRDPVQHERIKKPIASAYSLSVLRDYEPLVDEMVIKFMDCLEGSAKMQCTRICDMAVWMRLYSLDVIMHLSFSDSLGFLDVGGDISDFMGSLDRALDRAGLLITMPWTAYLVKHNPIVGWFVKDSSIFPAWVRNRIQKRIECRNGNKIEAPKDFLDRFLDAGSVKTAPGYDIPLIMNWTMTNIMAGADTTAIALRAILYYILKSPSKKDKLMTELQNANLSYPVTWEESQELRYLDACIKEAFRLHPAIGMGLERVVPPSGFLLPDGSILPTGTKVSINAWVLNRHAVFGKDTDEFIPERWLPQNEESAEEYKERIWAMKHADLAFGGGSRSCTGKYISFLEIYKVIPTLMLEFDISLSQEADEWTTVNRWALRQENIFCCLQRKSR